MKTKNYKFICYILTFFVACMPVLGCGQSNRETVEITVFAAKSLNNVLDEIITEYTSENPNVIIHTSYDSSGTLMTQIMEGANCDVFFSAAQKQMNQLDEEGLVISSTRADIINNQVCLVTYQNSETGVTGLNDLYLAESMALADGTVPVGKYTRVALMNAGILAETEDPATITTAEISDVLNGLTINECANVGAVAAAVSEGANEVGTVYYSDYKGYEDKLSIIEMLSYELTGDVIYPAAVIKNDSADNKMIEASTDFVLYLKSDKAKEMFEKYYFDVNVD